MTKWLPTAPFGLVYALSDPRTLRVRYVGQSRSMLRPLSHGYTLGGRDGPLSTWLLELHGRGLQPLVATIGFGRTREELNGEEMFWIEYHRAHGAPLLNLSTRGVAKASPRQRKRPSFAQRRVVERVERIARLRARRKESA